MSIFCNNFSKKRGSITMITAIASVLLIGIVALVTDVGYVYFEHSKLQTATNAAWKAGYDKVMQLRSEHKTLTENDQAAVKSHMMEVMAANGFDHLPEGDFNVLFKDNMTNLEVSAQEDVNLFFMNMFNVKQTKVSAARAGGENSAGILPIAIPHGEVHDLSWKTYDWVPFEDNEGFQDGEEYIIKLGEAEGSDPLGDEEYMIYIPVGLEGAQNSDNNTMLAYGAVFWALQIDEKDKDALTPAYWLLSNNGGGFLTRTSKDFERRLTSGDYRGVRYEKAGPDRILQILKKVGANVYSKEDINDYLTGIVQGSYVNSLIIPLTWRPQIAVYSSQADYDPVEQILRAAKIPYGKYALPNTSSNPSGWKRTENYDGSRNSKIFDLEILNGELGKYDWIHLHHEDFTGLTNNDGSSYNNGVFPTRCSAIKPGCYHNIAMDRKGTSTKSQEEANKVLQNLACDNCRSYMIIEPQEPISQQVTTYERVQKTQTVWDSKKRKYVTQTTWVNEPVTVVQTTYSALFKGWNEEEAVVTPGCKTGNYTRCGKCGRFDINDLTGQTNFSGCLYYNYLKTLGYEDDTAIPHAFTLDKSWTMEKICQEWFDGNATAYQKMKWDVAEIVKDHIMSGGFMYTQCFAAETLDLALQQGAYYKTRSVSESYQNCMVFENFIYKQLPKKNGYSSIDVINLDGDFPIQSAYKYSPLCQVSGNPNSGTGATCAFNKNYIKPSVDKMGLSAKNSSAYKYIGGKLTNALGELKGQFALMGGHWTEVINGKRLVLNNVLYGSTSDKQTSIGTHLTGRTKYQYGCIDPDNDGNKSASDYANRMLYGFESPINFADIIQTDNSKYTQESKKASAVITGAEVLDNYTPNTIVIVPIVGVPDSVKNYQSTVTKMGDQEINRNDLTIYDIKVGAYNSGAAESDNLGSQYTPAEVRYDNLKNSVQVIGFAKFRIMAEDEYHRSDVLGEALQGQIRGEFLGYVVDPREVADLMAQYNN